MWPWDHAAFGYVLYSLTRRLATGRPPPDRPVLVLAVATLLPDLVDKPLSWGLGLFPSGYSVGHSVFVAAPLAVIALVVGYRREALEEAVAFVVGYWSHLVGDVAYRLVIDGELTVSILLWPVVSLPPYGTDYGLLERGLLYFREYVAALRTGDVPLTLLVAYLGPLLAAGLLWIVDGCPGLAFFRRGGEQRGSQEPGD